MKRVVFREGDAARIVVAKRVVRVGYPKSLEDYAAEVEAKLGADVSALFQKVGSVSHVGHWLDEGEAKERRAYRRIIAELAHEMAVVDGFGGRERSLHFADAPEIFGEVGTVSRLRTVKTGPYFPPSGGNYRGGFDDDGPEPGGLRDEKVHRLAEIIGVPWPREPRRLRDASAQLWVPVYFLEKWMAGEPWQTAEEWRAARAGCSESAS